MIEWRERHISEKHLVLLLSFFVGALSAAAAALLKSFIAPKEEEPKSDVRVVGGDFFTQAQYDGVRREGDNVFSHYAARAAETASAEGEANVADSPFCTETLAQIYAEQGYYEQSRKIYSRLSLRYPEKSAYFASLIEKLDN